MESIKLKVQERAFPEQRQGPDSRDPYESPWDQGRRECRDLGRGDKKPVVVTIFADTLVEEGYIRLSPEDIAAAGAIPGMEVTVTRVPPIGERVKKSTEKTKENVKEDVKKAKETISKKASSTKESVEKGVESVKKNLKEKDL